MKKIFILVCCLLIAFATANVSLAHSGGTDENGGHYDNSTGEYHYHHGYPEHHHEDGVCPYDFEDKTNHTSYRYDVLNILKIIFYSFGYALIPSSVAFIFMPKTKNGWLLPIVTQIISTILIILIWLNL